MSWPLATLILGLAFIVVAASAIALLYAVERVRQAHKHRRIEASETIARAMEGRFELIGAELKTLRHKLDETRAQIPVRR